MNEKIKTIQEAIKLKAKRQVDDLLLELKGVVESNPILKELKIYPSHEAKDKDEGYVKFLGFCGIHDLLYAGNCYDLLKTRTNYLDIRKNLVEKFEKEETVGLLDKLEYIEEFLTNG